MILKNKKMWLKLFPTSVCIIKLLFVYNEFKKDVILNEFYVYKN